MPLIRGLEYSNPRIRFAQLIKLFSAFFQVAFSVYSSQQRCKLEPRGQVGSVQLNNSVEPDAKEIESFFIVGLVLIQVLAGL